MINKLKIINFKSESGYTLIELLAVIIILLAVGAIITTILVSALRGGNRSLSTNNVRQSGSYAISQMSKMITYSKSFVGISVVDEPSNYLRDCVLGNPLTQYHYLKLDSFDGGQTTFICDSTNPDPIASKSASAIDLVNPATIAVTQCYFTCQQSNVSLPPTIGISFDLNSKSAGTGITPVIEKQSQIHFETSVTLRNNL